MRERIFGTECEYALVYHPEKEENKTELSEETFLERMKELTDVLVSCLKGKGNPQTGEFLGNGGRFYIDRGGHPEYATPECRSVKDLVAYEKAGDRIVQELVEDSRCLLAERGGSTRLHIFKNNVDLFGNSYGGHENYLITAGAMDQIRAIIPFLVTRQIFTGAGLVSTCQGPGEIPFRLAQRSDFIDCVFSDRTSGVRGIINTRKREIPRQNKKRRLHIIVGDSNMSEKAIYLKIGTTGLILRLLEEGALLDSPTIRFPVQTLKGISRSLDTKVEIEGRPAKYTALEVQKIYLEKAHTFFASHPPSGEEKNILELWAHTLAGLEKLKLSDRSLNIEEDPDDLKRKIDWVLKLWLLGRTKQKSDIDWHDRRIKFIDLRYHDLDPKTGLFHRCRDLDLVDCLVEDEEINQARVDPPKNTRAFLRGMIMRQAMNKNVEILIENWENVKIVATKRMPGKRNPFDRYIRIKNALNIKLEDPFQSDDSTVFKEVKHFLELWD